MSATEPTMRVLSLGGGTQSCALALMSAAGELPRLDHVIFADTQGELPETYEYLAYLRGQLDAAGIPLHVVTAGNLLNDLLAPEPTTATNPTPPLHVLGPDGKRGKISQHRCSYDYKRRPVERKLKQLCGGRGAWKLATVEQWIGFSHDEAMRMKPATQCRCGHNRTATVKGEVVRIHTEADGCTRCACTAFDPWSQIRWPLAELGMKRHDTIRWFGDHGHPTPPRSACWFCPNSTNERWQQLRNSHPELFARACDLDEVIRLGGPWNDRGSKQLMGELFLHGSHQPLRIADLRTDTQVRADAGEVPLFDPDALGSCNGEVCFT